MIELLHWDTRHSSSVSRTAHGDGEDQHHRSTTNEQSQLSLTKRYKQAKQLPLSDGIVSPCLAQESASLQLSLRQSTKMPLNLAHGVLDHIIHCKPISAEEKFTVGSPECSTDLAFNFGTTDIGPRHEIALPALSSEITAIYNYAHLLRNSIIIESQKEYDSRIITSRQHALPLCLCPNVHSLDKNLAS
jgi:hypothetical protein